MATINLILRISVICLLTAGVVSCGGSSSELTSSIHQSDTTSGNLHLVRDLPPPANSANGLEPPLMAGDVLTIDVFQSDQLSRTVQIDARGRVSLPLIGLIDAAGHSLRDLELEIERLYGARYLQNPEVSVFLKDSAAQRVTVDGDVARAGLYPVASGTTLLDALALAGGFRDLADQSKVYVYRSVGEQRLVANFDVVEIRDGRASNPQIFGGDVVVVFRSNSLVAINNLKEALGLSARVATGLAALP